MFPSMERSATVGMCAVKLYCDGKVMTMSELAGTS